MIRKILFIFLLVILCAPAEGFGFWVWTPETNRWENPKYAAKDTPGEQLKYALEFFDKKDYKRAIKEFHKLIKHYSKAREAAEAQYYIGRAHEAEERLFDAFKAYQEVVKKYPFSDRAGEVIKRQYDIGNELLEGGPKRNKFLGAVIGDNFGVVEVFRTVIKNAPYGEYAAPSQYKIGLYLQEKKLFQEARDEFEKVVNDYPDSEWAKAAKYQIAVADANRSSEAQYDQKVTQAAVNEFKKFVQTYPDAELSQKAQDQIYELREKEAENNFLVAEFYEKQKNFKAAKIYYATVVDEFKSTTWAVKALKKIQAIESTAP